MSVLKNVAIVRHASTASRIPPVCYFVITTQYLLGRLCAMFIYCSSGKVGLFVQLFSANQCLYLLIHWLAKNRSRSQISHPFLECDITETRKVLIFWTVQARDATNVNRANLASGVPHALLARVLTWQNVKTVPCACRVSKILQCIGANTVSIASTVSQLLDVSTTNRHLHECFLAVRACIKENSFIPPSKTVTPPTTKFNSTPSSIPKFNLLMVKIKPIKIRVDKWITIEIWLYIFFGNARCHPRLKA